MSLNLQPPIFENVPNRFLNQKHGKNPDLLEGKFHTITWLIIPIEESENHMPIFLKNFTKNLPKTIEWYQRFVQ